MNETEALLAIIGSIAYCVAGFMRIGKASGKSSVTSGARARAALVVLAILVSMISMLMFQYVRVPNALVGAMFMVVQTAYIFEEYEKEGERGAEWMSIAVALASTLGCMTVRSILSGQRDEADRTNDPDPYADEDDDAL